MPPVTVEASMVVYPGGTRPTAGLVRRMGRLTPNRRSAPGGKGSSACSASRSAFGASGAIGSANANWARITPTPTSANLSNRMVMGDLLCDEDPHGSRYPDDDPLVAHH